MMPQLRVRTEYNYRRTYGPVARIAERLGAMGEPASGIVDAAGTWGHVDWDQHIANPMFGVELSAPQSAGSYWVLAEDLPSLYRLASDPPDTTDALAEVTGVVRFAGAALTDPETFDYIDINPRSRLRTKHALALARRTGKPLVITGDNDYPAREDRNVYLAWNDVEKMTPQWIADESELRAAMPYVDDDVWSRAVRSTHEVAERCAGLKLNRAPIISMPGDLADLVERGKKYRLARGHIAQWTPEYQQRVQRELALIRDKGYESYFLVVTDMVNWAKEHMLVGPGRGSSAGSLVCYLLRITEVDPLAHDLLFERFIDINRADLPDIDVDFNDAKRHEVFEHMAQAYGAQNVARIGNVLRLKPRSVLAHVGKKLGIPHGATFSVINVLIEYSSGDARYGKGLEDTLTNTQPGRDFLVRYPEARLMGELENHASHSGVHAAGLIVANVAVTDYCTVRNGVAQVDKKGAEALGLLKIDVLGLRTLGVIEDAGVITPEELYDLKLNDPEVFSIFNDGKFSGLFQFEGAAQRRVATQIPVTNFAQIDHITALSRPGPLGGGAANTYINRFTGREGITYRHQSMEEYLAGTQGVVLYQEQVMRIVRELGGFSWEDTSVIRKAMSGRKGTEFFDRMGEQFTLGAQQRGIPADVADQIWHEIVNFGAWGMNRSHTVSYSIISYWCAYLKRYHALAYAAALLRNAKDDEQVIETLRELEAEQVTYTPFDPDFSDVSWTAASNRLVGGFTNLIGIGPVKARHYVEKRNTGQLTESDRAKLARYKVKYAELHPAHALWGEVYSNPDAHNINGPVREFAELKNEENAVVIARLVRLERRDENEARRVNRRGYLKKGQTLFLDAFMVDDSVSKPVRVRLRPRAWREYGERMADKAVAGKDWFLIRGRWLEQFSMMIVQKIKCLTNKDVFK